jgi:F0F1-type ATP synthase assembly protein I
MALCITNSVAVAIAFLNGALACWLGELCFSAMLYKKISRKKPQGFLWLFFLAEFVKLSVYAIFFVALIKIFHLSLAPTTMGFVINLILFWITSFRALGNF